jgi:hypothetical protein
MDTKRCRAGAAGSTNFQCVACNKGSCRKTVIDDWSSAVRQVSKLLFALFYFYFNYFSNYTRYFKTRKWDSLQKWKLGNYSILSVLPDKFARFLYEFHDYRFLSLDLPPLPPKRL